MDSKFVSEFVNKPKYTKTEDITVTKTDPSLLIFGGGNFQMKWAKKWLSNTLTHSHHIFIKMLWPTKEQFSIQFILFCYCYNKVIKLWWKSVIPSDIFFSISDIFITFLSQCDKNGSCTNIIIYKFMHLL